MRTPTRALILAVSIFLGWAGWKSLNAVFHNPSPALWAGLERGAEQVKPKIQKSAEEWKKELTPEQYKVMIQCGTEPPFSGTYNDFWEPGFYHCAACDALLFGSETKYEHGTGWPSFTAPESRESLVFLEDRSHGMVRTEVRCANCGAHLGHVFDDGPPPSNLHYCINSAALTFKAGAKKTAAPETATFAAGCFWGVEDKFSRLPGILDVVAGYTGGHTKNPTYKDVCSDETGHAESVRVTFNPALVSYEDLVRAFFGFHDPTQLNRQGPDVGAQYRSVIFYHDDAQKRSAEKIKAEFEASGKFGKRIVTELSPAADFYEAEAYHQDYYKKKKKLFSLIF